MSESRDEEKEKPYQAEYAKSGRSKCQVCGQIIEKEALRLAKMAPSSFDPDKLMALWHHADCLFDKFSKNKRKDAKVIRDVSEIAKFDELKEEDKKLIKKRIANIIAQKGGGDGGHHLKQATLSNYGKVLSPTKAPKLVAKGEELSGKFAAYVDLCNEIRAESSYTGKTNIVRSFLDSFDGDRYLLCKLLLPGIDMRRFQVQDKQLIKLFSRVFSVSATEMVLDLEQTGDVASTIQKFATGCLRQSTMSLQAADEYLDRLSKLSREDEQEIVFSELVRQCTPDDLQMMIRLVKRDLKINAGEKHVLEALGPNAYQAFQLSRDLRKVIETGGKGIKDVSLLIPIKPMLAEACKHFAAAVSKYPQGMFAEIKYDGERVQVHKHGDEFQYYSRNLKPVQPHKVAHIKKYLPKVLPQGDTLILDGEVLLWDPKTQKPLPFGSLNIHKQKGFKDATSCLFIFDCLYLNGRSLLNLPLQTRRQILEEHIDVSNPTLQNHIRLSEYNIVTKAAQIGTHMERVMRDGLEGLVLKAIDGVYEPGKRHWLKLKKDYLNQGAMADTADLVVLGAYFGKGKNGGDMTIFLMGCYDPVVKKWKTVTKCGNGHDDATLKRLQSELVGTMNAHCHAYVPIQGPNMIKISGRVDNLPNWLLCNNPIVPDFVVRDPKQSPVWEITGAEFSKSTTHTADGISIRFPRVTRIRDDKDWKSATNMQELKKLAEVSSDNLATSIATVEDEETGDVDEAEGVDWGTEWAGEEPSTLLSTDSKGKAFEKRPLVIEPRAREPKPKQARIESKQRPPVLRVGKRDTQAIQQRYGVLDPLPDVFSGCVVKLADGIRESERAELRRHIIAFNGTLADEQTPAHLVTHVIGTKEGEGAYSTKWAWHCIDTRSIQPS